MSQNAAVLLISIFSLLGAVCFIVVVVGLVKPSLVIRNVARQTRGRVLFVWGSAWMLSGLGMFITAAIAGSNLPDSETPPVVPRAYYVGANGANIRACPDISCEILDTIPQNTPLTFPGNLYDKYPDWAEITMQNGDIGYVSKTTLSSEITEAPAPSTPRADTIVLAPFTYDDVFYVGYTYTISFCAPESARTGATCGGLAGETRNPVGGTPPYSFVKKSGFLPPGMSLELNGLISGSPTVPGTYNFKLCAKDLRMNEGCEDYTFVVAKEDENVAAPSSPSDPVSPPEPPSAEEGSLKINTAECRIYKEHDTCASDGTLCTHYVDNIIIGSGSASGAVGAKISFGSNPSFSWSFDDYGPLGITCSSWTTKFGSHYATSCVREPGQPFTTNWTATIAGGGYSTNYPTRNRSITFDGYLTDTPVTGTRYPSYRMICIDD